MSTPWPQLYNPGFTAREAVLDEAFGVVVTEQLLDDGSSTNPAATGGGTGQLTVTFNVPRGPKADLLMVEKTILITYPQQGGTDVFVIRSVTEGADSSGRITTVTGEGRWYDLGTAYPIQIITPITAPMTAMATILTGTGWAPQVGPGVPTLPNPSFLLDTHTSPLAGVRALPQAFGGEIVFDTVGRAVTLQTVRGKQVPELMYSYGGNLSANSRVVDSTQLVTRLIPTGANEVGITTVNGGLGYIDNNTWYDQQGWSHVVKTGTATNDKISDPAALKAWAVTQLAMLCRPRVTYTISPVRHRDDPMPGVGDAVRVWDPSLRLDVQTRVVQRDLNVLEPWLTTVQLGATLFQLASVIPAKTPPVVGTVSSAPVFVEFTPPAGVVGQMYGYQFTAHGVPAPMTFTLTGGSLPVGLTLTSGGLLVGSPTASGMSTFTVTVTNGVAPAAAAACTMTVAGNPPVFTAAQPPGATVGVAYTYQFAASGSPAPVFSFTTFTTPGGLPSGCTLSAAGVLSGTPTTPGQAIFRVIASNGVLPDATTDITMTVT